MNSKMKNGACPQCDSKEVYETENGIGGSEITFIKRGRFGLMATTMLSYLCVKCGYFENYITNEKHLDEISKSGRWIKV